MSCHSWGPSAKLIRLKLGSGEKEVGQDVPVRAEFRTSDLRQACPCLSVKPHGEPHALGGEGQGPPENGKEHSEASGGTDKSP